MTEPATKAQGRWKRRLLTVAQVSITGGVLWFMLRDPAKRAEYAAVLRHADRSWLIAGAFTYGIVELLAAWRWERLLAVQGIVLDRMRLLTLLLIGLFFNFFIPGGTGGDVVKVFYLIRESRGRGAAAVLSVLIDRIVGLLTLVLLSSIFIALRWDWLTIDPYTGWRNYETHSYVITTLIILGVSSGFVAFAAILSALGLVHRLPARFPARARMAELALALNQYGRAPGRFLQASGLSMCVHLAYIFLFYCATQALSEPGRKLPGLYDLCAIMPVVNTITSLPISIGGIGVREGLFVTFLSELSQVHEAVAMAIGTTGFLLTAVWGVLGGVIYLFYRPSEHTRVAEITRQVYAVEDAVAQQELALELEAETASCPAPEKTAR